MKKFLSLLSALILLMTFMVGCGSKDRVLYTEKLSKYVELGKYKGIEIDTKSAEFEKAYDEIVASDIENNNLYVKKTSGAVAKGDVANIDYVGKKDGVAFEGGTAQGYDLEIGSGSFIEGFEDGLIGKNIGDTVDLNLTFPKDYQSADLAGAAVVFTVKINHVTTKDPLAPSEFYGELGFGSEAKYIEDVNARAVKDMLLAKLEETSKIKEYPEKDQEFLYAENKKLMESNLKNYGYDFDSYLSMVGQTEEKFREETMTNQIKPLMDTQMILYSVLDEVGLEVTNTDINAQAEKVVKSYNNEVTVEQVKEVYGEYQLEYIAVNEKVLDYLYDNAVIK